MNLIDEIEVKKINIEGYHNEKYADGFIDGINEALEAINQYNIITAPKSIKLSELIDKIYETKFKSESWVKPIKEGNNYYRIRVQYGDGYWGDYEFYIVKGKISSNLDMDLPRDEFKWLYTLWIAGTEIVDDLECDE